MFAKFYIRSSNTFYDNISIVQISLFFFSISQFSFDQTWTSFSLLFLPYYLAYSPPLKRHISHFRFLANKIKSKFTSHIMAFKSYLKFLLKHILKTNSLVMNLILMLHQKLYQLTRTLGAVKKRWVCKLIEQDTLLWKCVYENLIRRGKTSYRKEVDYRLANKVQYCWSFLCNDEHDITSFF